MSSSHKPEYSASRRLQVEVEATQPVFGASPQQGDAHETKDPHFPFMDLRHVPQPSGVFTVSGGGGEAEPLLEVLGGPFQGQCHLSSGRRRMPVAHPKSLRHRFLSKQGEGHASFSLTSASSPGE